MPRLISWAFAIGGTILLAGSLLHPDEHVDGGTMQQQFHAMFSNANWYPSHVLLLVGLALLTVAVVGLARMTPPTLPRRTTWFAAIMAVIATAAMVLHLVAKLDDANIVAGEKTPLLFAHAMSDTVIIPLFGIAFALLAIAGGRSRVLGNPFIAALGVIGGLGYALAAATAPFMETFTPLFELVRLLGVWALVIGAIHLLRGHDAWAPQMVAR